MSCENEGTIKELLVLEFDKKRSKKGNLRTSPLARFLINKKRV